MNKKEYRVKWDATPNAGCIKSGKAESGETIEFHALDNGRSSDICVNGKQIYMAPSDEPLHVADMFSNILSFKITTV
jgi:predicted metalloenzyme YecM